MARRSFTRRVLNVRPPVVKGRRIITTISAAIELRRFIPIEHALVQGDGLSGILLGDGTSFLAYSEEP